MISYRTSDLLQHFKNKNQAVDFTVHLRFTGLKMYFEGLTYDDGEPDNAILTKMKKLEDIIYGWPGAKMRNYKLYYDAGASGAGINDIIFDLKDHLRAYQDDLIVQQSTTDTNSPDMSYAFRVTVK